MGGRGLGRFAHFVWALALCAIVAGLGWPYRWPDYGSDVREYRTFAIAGEPSHVHRQFAGRILHPLIVHAVANLGGIGVDYAFLIVAVTALALCVIAVAALWREIGAPAPALVPLLCTPFLVDQFWRIYSQGLLEWAIVAWFFLLLERGRVWLAAALLFLACITRESALLLAAAVVVVALTRGNRRLLALSLAATAGAFALTGAVARNSLPNLHHVNGALFFALKFPFEFSRNMLGLTLVPNTLANSPGNNCAPVFRVMLPEFLRFGDLAWVSYCGFDLHRMLATFSVLACGFGVGPAVLVALSRRCRRRFSRAAGWLLTALLYGVIAYLVGTSEGTALYDEIGSGWPAFWIGVPALMAMGERPGARTIAMLLACNAAVSWMLPLASRSGAAGLAIIIGLALTADVFAYREAAKEPVRSAASPDESTSSLRRA
ncbi:MAG TPA: hypothetical protein VJ718_00885 [Candidatus Binataceae bacterium]|nr:hypothetical protein [Candidatus Binataceae bacterium]